MTDDDLVRIGDWVSVNTPTVDDQFRGRVVGMHYHPAIDSVLLDVRLIGITIETTRRMCRKLNDDEKLIAIARQALRIHHSGEKDHA